MIPTLHIQKLEPGLYCAELTDTPEGRGEFEVGNIAEAIRASAAGAGNQASAFHIWYEHVSIGTNPTAAMRHDAETMAQRLMVLHGQFR